METEREKLYNNIKEFGYRIGGESYEKITDAKKGNFQFRYWYHPEENCRLNGTPFFYDDENDFIHFTSLDSLYSIIDSGFIRLYNLNNMDDKLEMEYAVKELSFKQSYQKTNGEIYCFSMCSSKKTLNDETKQHLLWKLHGRDGRGVIIRVRIERNLDKWHCYYLSQVFYNIEQFAAIKKFHTEIHNEILDNRICCFIKHPIYEFENEIRLVFNNTSPAVSVIDKDNRKIYPITHFDKERNTSYFQIPLINFNHLAMDDYHRPNPNFEIPKINITEIILGYRSSDQDLEKIQSKFGSLLPDVKIKFTDLKKYF